jgi:hypothetical protein
MKHIALLSLAAASVASAQSIKPRPLGPVQATSLEVLGSPTVARALPNGSVIVNDVLRRRLLLLDPTLQKVTVIADSTSGATNGYGPRAGALIPYVGDSTLFLDPVAGSFVVIDPAGKPTRVMSPPRPNDNGAISNFGNGFPGFDAKGRMVYRTNYPVMPFQTRDGNVQMPTRPDSAPLIRVDLDTRRADTLTAIRTPKMLSSSITLPNGGQSMMMTQAPLSTIDDWAVLSDGTIAVVRGRDYRIDFIQADGTKRTTDKLAFDWKRLSDDDKLALIDSIQKARAANAAGGGPGGPQVMFGGGDMRIVMGGGGRGDMAGAERMAVGAMAAASMPAPAPVTGAAPAASSSTTTTGTAASSGSAGSSAAGSSAAGTTNTATPNANGGAAAAGAPAGAPQLPSIPAPAIADMPDYMPAFTQTSARADADANLWIRTTTPGAQPGNVVYDVINSQGVVVDRVDVPKGMQIIGFAKGGIVYLSQREGYQYRVLKASVK